MSDVLWMSSKNGGGKKAHKKQHCALSSSREGEIRSVASETIPDWYGKCKKCWPDEELPTHTNQDSVRVGEGSMRCWSCLEHFESLDKFEEHLEECEPAPMLEYAERDKWRVDG